MKRLLISLLSVFAITLYCHLPAVSYAADACGAKEASAKSGKTEKCPVTGEPVDVKTANYTTTYKGKKYYFCCKDCVAQFKKDPKKYIGKAAKKSKGTCSIEEHKD